MYSLPSSGSSIIVSGLWTSILDPPGPNGCLDIEGDVGSFGDLGDAWPFPEAAAATAAAAKLPELAPAAAACTAAAA